MIFLPFVPALAQAHNPGESYVYFQVSEEELRGRLEITLKDILSILPRESVTAGANPEAIFEANQAEFMTYLRDNMSFYVDGIEHKPVFTDFDFLTVSWATFVRLNFLLPGIGAPPGSIEAEYTVLFNDAVTGHRGLIHIESNTRSGIEANEAQFSAVFGRGSGRQTLSLDVIPWQNVFVSFVKHGVWHIWIGFDHVLFLVALLIPSVMVYRSSSWQPTETFRESFINVVKVVTLFTLAHTVTLSLAALGVFQLPVQLVEAVIALSIAAVALNNIWPYLRSRSWLLVFVFGLFHGLGFANVLAPLGGDTTTRGPALLGFNVGVELGQLVIILAVFPVLYSMRSWRGYRPLVLQGTSALLIAVSCFWFVERTVDVPFLSSETFKLGANTASPQPGIIRNAGEVSG